MYEQAGSIVSKNLDAALTEENARSEGLARVLLFTPEGQIQSSRVEPNGTTILRSTASNDKPPANRFKKKINKCVHNNATQ